MLRLVIPGAAASAAPRCTLLLQVRDQAIDLYIDEIDPFDRHTGDMADHPNWPCGA